MIARPILILIFITGSICHHLQAQPLMRFGCHIGAGNGTLVNIREWHTARQAGIFFTREWARYTLEAGASVTLTPAPVRLYSVLMGKGYKEEFLTQRLMGNLRAHYNFQGKELLKSVYAGLDIGAVYQHSNWIGYEDPSIDTTIKYPEVDPQKLIRPLSANFVTGILFEQQLGKESAIQFGPYFTYTLLSPILMNEYAGKQYLFAGISARLILTFLDKPEASEERE